MYRKRQEHVQRYTYYKVVYMLSYSSVRSVFHLYIDQFCNALSVISVYVFLSVAHLLYSTPCHASWCDLFYSFITSCVHTCYHEHLSRVCAIILLTICTNIYPHGCAPYHTWIHICITPVACTCRGIATLGATYIRAQVTI